MCLTDFSPDVRQDFPLSADVDGIIPEQFWNSTAAPIPARSKGLKKTKAITLCSGLLNKVD
jgi:hypothetical protein